MGSPSASSRWRVSQLLLGIEGLALLRRWVTGDPGAIGARVGEIEELCRRYRSADPADQIVVDEVGAVRGYAALAEGYDGADNPLIETEAGPVRRLLDDLPRGRVLDAACGTGRHAAYLVGLGHDVTGVDASRPMLERAATKAPEARFVQGDLEALPIASNSHDAVVCSLALTHLAGLQGAMAELARVVRPEGDVILSDIHPFAAPTGAHVAVDVEPEGFLLVRTHLHPHSRYLSAFAEHVLRIDPWLMQS